MKRLFDVFTSMVLLICLSPIILIMALLVRIKLGTPVLFIQQRPGLYGKPFYLYKFRSMTDEKDTFGTLSPDHIRLTAFGKFMRKFSLDELPQLFNVLKGDLSLVGPRPLLMEYLPLYTVEQLRRHYVRPGITGWAQINGRNAISWEEKFEYDLWYVENHNFFLDLKILFWTFLKVIKSDGIRHGDHATMPEFKGSLKGNERM